jgi:hypothetical protein
MMALRAGRLWRPRVLRFATRIQALTRNTGVLRFATRIQPLTRSAAADAEYRGASLRYANTGADAECRR